MENIFNLDLYNLENLNEGFKMWIIIYAILGGMFVGMFPFIYGVIKNQFFLGLLSFILCTIGGYLLGVLLSVPICICFIYYIRKNYYLSLKKCSWCFEFIRTEAVICKHCKKELVL